MLLFASLLRKAHKFREISLRKKPDISAEETASVNDRVLDCNFANVFGELYISVILNAVKRNEESLLVFHSILPSSE